MNLDAWDETAYDRKASSRLSWWLVEPVGASFAFAGVGPSKITSNIKHSIPFGMKELPITRTSKSWQHLQTVWSLIRRTVPEK